MRVVAFDVLAAEPEMERRYQEVSKITIHNELAAHFAVLRHSLETLELTVGEASLIVDAMRGVITGEIDYRYFWAGIEDAIEAENLDSKWNVDGEALIKTLQALSPGHCLAIVDAALRFWSRECAGLSTTEALIQVGLIRPEGYGTSDSGSRAGTQPLSP